MASLSSESVMLRFYMVHVDVILPLRWISLVLGFRLAGLRTGRNLMIPRNILFNFLVLRKCKFH